MLLLGKLHSEELSKCKSTHKKNFITYQGSITDIPTFIHLRKSSFNISVPGLPLL